VEANLKSRWVTAFVAIPLLILIIGWGDARLFVGLFLFVTIVALHEFFSMAFPGLVGEQVVGILFGIGLFLSVFEFESPAIGLSLFLLSTFLIYLFMGGELKERLMRLAWTLLGGFYLGYLLPHWILLFRLPRGRSWVAFVLLVVMLGDSVAYFVGRRFGTRKLAPKISPGKTVEGSLGYIIGSVAAGLVAGKWLLPELPAGEIVAISAIASVLGQLGDLFESWIKRAFGVKDSGQLLPGHGGVLDRLDSLIFPAVFTSAYLRIFHP
jgi:phosphatidate cytidylyltransferase